MAAVQFDGGNIPIDIPVAFTGDFEVLHPVQRTEDITPLRRHRMVMFPYRLRNGRPVDVPVFDISGKSLLTSAVDGIIALRPQQLEVNIQSDYRWIGTSDYYDVTGRIWYPIQARNEYIWRTNSTYFPALNPEYSYFVNNEFLTFESVSFTEARSDHFWSDFRGGLDASTEYTIVLVAAFRPPTGANTTGLVRPYYAIWDGGRQPSGTGTFTEDTSDRAVMDMFYDGFELSYEGQGQINVLNADVALRNARPVILTLTANTQQLEMGYLGKGGLRSNTVMPLSDDYVLFQFEFLLGRPNGTDDPDFCANMEILELNFFGQALDDVTLNGTTALLDGIYGVTA
jgi:hypothetical protein